MADLSGFNAEEHEPMMSFDPLPDGEYLAVITESQEKANSKGTGSYVKLTFEIIEGEHTGRKIWTQLNLDNPSLTAMKIARSELAAICLAVGVTRPSDSQELHDIPLVIKVKVVKRQDTGEMKNEIKGYMSREEAKAKKAGNSAAGKPGAGQPAGGGNNGSANNAAAGSTVNQVAPWKRPGNKS